MVVNYNFSLASLVSVGNIWRKSRNTGMNFGLDPVKASDQLIGAKLKMVATGDKTKKDLPILACRLSRKD